jgi:hypothetical protein
MYYRVKLAFALGLTLAAVAAVPAGAMLMRAPFTRDFQPIQTSANVGTTPCSEVCSGGGYGTATGSHLTIGAIRRVQPVASHNNTGRRPVLGHAGRFAWGDAGIGAGVAIAFLVAIAAGAATTRRARRLGASSATVAG